jgi:malonyl CoA-acyl carrier protein transacylase
MGKWLRRQRANLALTAAGLCFGFGYGFDGDHAALQRAFYAAAAAIVVAMILVPGIPAARRLRARGEPLLRTPGVSRSLASLGLFAALVVLAAVLGFLTVIAVVVSLTAASMAVLAAVRYAPARHSRA